MSQLLKLSIDVTKITKEKLYKGKKGTYLDLVVAVNDEPDNFGNNVSCWENQKEGETEPKKYLGNGKTFWTNDGNAPKTTKPSIEDDNDLPF